MDWSGSCLRLQMAAVPVALSIMTSSQMTVFSYETRHLHTKEHFHDYYIVKQQKMKEKGLSTSRTKMERIIGMLV
jgi:hypothetical protein